MSIAENAGRSLNVNGCTGLPNCKPKACRDLPPIVLLAWIINHGRPGLGVRSKERHEAGDRNRPGEPGR